MLTGKCLCEGVRFEIAGALTPLGYCHCKQCQRASEQPNSVRIRLGLVDGDPQLHARAHVWVSAKAPRK